MKLTKSSLTRMRPKTLRKHETDRTATNFFFFENEGIVTCNGPTLLFAPNPGGKKTPPVLLGKALCVTDAKRIAKDLPKGNLGKDIELSSEKGQLFVKDARGTVHQAPLETRAAYDWRDRSLPKHDDYYEVAANPRELRAAIMSVEQLERDRNLVKGGEPSITLRVSRNPEHPIELCSKHGVFGMVAPQEKSLIAHVFGRVSKWFKGLTASDTSTRAGNVTPIKELANAA